MASSVFGLAPSSDCCRGRFFFALRRAGTFRCTRFLFFVLVGFLFGLGHRRTHDCCNVFDKPTKLRKVFAPSQSSRLGVWTLLNLNGRFTLSIFMGTSFFCSKASVASALTYSEFTDRLDHNTITHFDSFNAFSITSSKRSPARSFGSHQTLQPSFRVHPQVFLPWLDLHACS